MSLIQEGNYTAEVTDQALSKTKKGVPQFVLRFRISMEERNLYMFLTESAMPYTKENLRKIGYKGTGVAELDLNHPNRFSFIGSSIDVYCKHEMYDGKLQEKWALSGNQGIHSNPPSTAELSSLDKLFSRAAEPSREPKPPVASGAMVNNHGLEVTDDDIPF